MKKQLREEIKKDDRQAILDSTGFQLLQPVEYWVDESRGWVSGGYVVGAIGGERPAVVISVPSGDGSDFEGGEPEFVPLAELKRLRSVGQSEAKPVSAEKPKAKAKPRAEAAPITTDVPPPAHGEAHRARVERVKKHLKGLHSGETLDLKIGITDITPYIEQISHRIAEEKVREYMNQKPWHKKLLSGLMHLSEDGYRRAFYNEAMDAITSNRNVMTQIEARVFGRGTTTATQEGEIRTLEILDEIMAGLQEDLIHKEQKGDQFVADAAVNAATNELFTQYATGTITDRTAFDQRVESDIIPLLHGKKFSEGTEKNATSERENRMHASNLWHWAEALKDQIKELHDENVAEHGEQNSEAVKKYLNGILRLDVQLAKHSRDVVNRAPEAKLKWFEKFSSGLQNATPFTGVNKVLGWTMGNPVLHGIVGALATRGGLRWGATGLATVGLAALSAPAGLAITGVLAGAATAGVLAKWRASKELKQDRGMVQRDAALGLQSGGPRSTEMHQYVQQMEDAETIVQNLRSIAASEQDPERRAAAFTVIADIRARLEIERHNMIDMISVSGEEGKQFNSRIFSLNEIQRELKRLSPLMTDEAALRTLVDEKKAELLNAIATQDENFEKFRKTESNKRALKGAMWGLAGATLMAGARELFPDGPFAAAGKKVGAAVKSLYSWASDSSDGPVLTTLESGIALPAVRMQEIPFRDGYVRLPENYVFTADDDGTAVIKTLDGRSVTPAFRIGPDGVISDADIEMLEEQGMRLNHVTKVVPGTDFSSRMMPWEMSNHTLTQHFEYPEDMNLAQNPDGTFDIYKSGKLIEAGLVTNKDGLFNEHSIEMLRSHGWEPKQGMNIAYRSLDKGALTQYLREHFGQEKVVRHDWHGNGTPMHKVGEHWVVSKDGMSGKFSVGKEPTLPAGSGWNVKHVAGRWMGADGKELMLRLQGDANNRVLSVKEMIATAIAGKVNPDLSVDGKFEDISEAVYKKEFADAAKNFRLRVFVGDNYWKSGESFELPIGPDGELHVKPGDELYNVLYDDKGNLKATVEAVIPGEDGKGYHTLATAVRHGDGAGVVSHKAAYIHLAHPSKDSVHHYYSFEEMRGGGGNTPQPEPFVIPGPHPHPEPLPPIPDDYGDTSWIMPFPTPFHARRAMEMPNDGEGKMSPRTKKPLVPGRYPTDREAARDIVAGFGTKKKNETESTAAEQPVKGTILVDGVEVELTVAERTRLAHAAHTYVIKEGLHLDERHTAKLIVDLYKALRLEQAKPYDWKKPIILSDTSKFEDQLHDTEFRMLVANKRPEQITFMVPDSYFVAHDIAEKDRAGFVHVYESMAIATFVEHGFLERNIHVIGERTSSDYDDGRFDGPEKPDREYPVLARIRKDSENPEIAALNERLRAIRSPERVASPESRMVFGGVTGYGIPKVEDGSASEDEFLNDKDNGVYAVFDGMGGNAGGRLASQAAYQELLSHTATLRAAANQGREALENTLRSTFSAMDRNIREAASARRLSNPGTTALLAVPFMENGLPYVAVASAGDCRGYVVTESGEVLWATRDFLDMSEEMEQKLRAVEDRSELNTEELFRFNNRNVISGALGPAIKYKEAAIPHITIVPVPPGKFRIALMSDGVSDNLTEKEISAIIGQTDATNSEITEGLIEASKRRAAEVGVHHRAKPDDMTAIIADIETVPGEIPAEPSSIDSRTELVRKYLMYKDINPDWDSSEEESKENAQSYGAALEEMIADPSYETAHRKIRRTFDALMKKSGLETSRVGKSESWIHWDLAKQYHFFKNPDKAMAGYDIGNPLTDRKIAQQISDRHFGWELYTKGNAGKQEFEMSKALEDALEIPEVKKLFKKKPKENGTLSSKDLAELGRLVRESMN